ncbi:nucleotide sugar dehydrogenase [Streptomyces sp. NPDC060064]|uniref:nucleotide sugar dehydrogenase n=1 Tax=Streptomyces sp. NPDC060064 TaxID=3347049 RepID=UPI0036C8E7A4
MPIAGGRALPVWPQSSSEDRTATAPEPVDRRPVAIVGMGYVGLPTALALLASGNEVIGLDASQQRIDDIRASRVDLVSDDHERLRKFAGSDTCTLTTDPERLAAAGTVVICVPTPVDEHLVPDLTALSAACATVVEHAVPGQTIVLTSTSYVGTTRDLLLRPLADRDMHAGRDVFVAFSPERIDPGNTVHPQNATPRVVGGETEECTRRAVAVLRGSAPEVHQVGSPEAAEMCKLLENTFRAVNIALANEFATACGHLGLEVTEVINAAATKPYGFMPFRPGPGVGGHCIPCDPHYLLWQLRRQRVALPLIDTAMTAIATRPRKVVRRARELLADRGVPLSRARVLVLGVSYKPDVDDLRESPALEILAELTQAGAVVSYTDPRVTELAVAGKRMESEAKPQAQIWDLVVVHTIHRGQDLDWLEEQPLVLDATYRLDAVKGRTVV